MWLLWDEKNKCNACGWNDTGVAYTHDTFGVQGVAVGFNADQSEKAYSMGETVELSPTR